MNAMLKRIATGAVVVLGLAACGSSAPAPQDQYYRANPGTPTANTSHAILPGVVMVERFAAEGLTSGRAINYVDPASPNQLKQYFYHHWSEPPNVMLRDTLVRYLRDSGAATTVVTPAVRVASDYTINGAVHILERRLGPPITAVIELEFSVTDTAKGTLLHVDTYRTEMPANGATLDETISAFNAGLADIYGKLLADLSRR